MGTSRRGLPLADPVTLLRDGPTSGLPMWELFGWIEIADWVATLRSRQTRRDYPLVLLVIMSLVVFGVVYLRYFH